MTSPVSPKARDALKYPHHASAWSGTPYSRGCRPVGRRVGRAASLRRHRIPPGSPNRITSCRIPAGSACICALMPTWSGRFACCNARLHWRANIARRGLPPPRSFSRAVLPDAGNRLNYETKRPSILDAYRIQPAAVANLATAHPCPEARPRILE
jgi:hypothetical protein